MQSDASYFAAKNRINGKLKKIPENETISADKCLWMKQK